MSNVDGESMPAVSQSQMTTEKLFSSHTYINSGLSNMLPTGPDAKSSKHYQ